MRDSVPKTEGLFLLHNNCESSGGDESHETCKVNARTAMKIPSMFGMVVLFFASLSSAEGNEDCFDATEQFLEFEEK